MAIAFDTSSYLNFTATSGTSSYTCTGSNRILFALTLNQGGTDDITGVTYNGNAMTQSGAGIGTGGQVLRLWYIYDSGMPSSGVAANIVVSRSTSNDTWNVFVSYNGVSQTGFPDASSFFNDSTSPYTGTITTIANNCWTILMGYTVSSGQTASTGSTFRQNNTSATYQLYDSNGVITPAGSTSMSYTAANQNSANIMFSFAPYVVSGPTNLKSYNTNLKANIKSINTNLIANVKSLDTNV